MVFWGHFEFFFTLIDYFWVAVRPEKYFLGHLLQTDNFHIIRFLSSGEELLGLVMSVGPSVGRSVGPWKILTIFDIKVS